MVGSIVGTNNPLKGEVMESVSIDKMLDNGKFLRSLIMSTLRVAVVCNIKHLTEGAAKYDGPVVGANLHSANQYLRLLFTMETKGREDWTYTEWCSIQTCLINLGEEDGLKMHRDCKGAALDYVQKQMDRKLD